MDTAAKIDESTSEADGKLDESTLEIEFDESATEIGEKFDESAAENAENVDESALEIDEKFEKSASEIDEKFDEVSSEPGVESHESNSEPDDLDFNTWETDGGPVGTVKEPVVENCSDSDEENDEQCPLVILRSKLDYGLRLHEQETESSEDEDGVIVENQKTYYTSNDLDDVFESAESDSEMDDFEFFSPRSHCSEEKTTKSGGSLSDGLRQIQENFSDSDVDDEEICIDNHADDSSHSIEDSKQTLSESADVAENNNASKLTVSFPSDPRHSSEEIVQSDSDENTHSEKDTMVSIPTLEESESWDCERPLPQRVTKPRHRTALSPSQSELRGDDDVGEIVPGLDCDDGDSPVAELAHACCTDDVTSDDDGCRLDGQSGLVDTQWLDSPKGQRTKAPRAKRKNGDMSAIAGQNHVRVDEATDNCDYTRREISDGNDEISEPRLRSDLSTKDENSEDEMGTNTSHVVIESTGPCLQTDISVSANPKTKRKFKQGRCKDNGYGMVVEAMRDLKDTIPQYWVMPAYPTQDVETIDQLIEQYESSLERVECLERSSQTCPHDFVLLNQMEREGVSMVSRWCEDCGGSENTFKALVRQTQGWPASAPPTPQGRRARTVAAESSISGRASLPGSPMKSRSLRLDKGCSTEDLGPGCGENVTFLKTCFPTVPEEDLLDVFERCNCDVQWTVNLLLDSGYEQALISPVVPTEESPSDENLAEGPSTQSRAEGGVTSATVEACNGGTDGTMNDDPTNHSLVYSVSATLDHLRETENDATAEPAVVLSASNENLLSLRDYGNEDEWVLCLQCGAPTDDKFAPTNSDRAATVPLQLPQQFAEKLLTTFGPIGHLDGTSK